ncbi:MAG: dihydroorotate dehydrogenase electron transfer subunit [Candidatus Saganbacteria bacterium]|nr:dihydroorotate dehydrogenase electron transfer subunit [Candidatus Saganbacteria bacterium]
MAIQEKCRIEDHKQVGPRHYKLTLASQYLASHAQPGQFVNVRCCETSDPLLRRPISLHRIDAQKGMIELLYEVVGRGTELLSKKPVGQELDLLGPLGAGFKIDPAKKIHLMAGGGMGIAPLRALAEQVTGRGSRVAGQAVYILIGAKNKESLIGEDELRKTTDQVQTATDDGSAGKKGVVTDLLLDFLDSQLSVTSYPLSVIYACGPRLMLKAVAEIARQKKIDCQLSLEERMACGIGACKGCPVKTVSGYKMVCKDGPVFDAKELVWN